MKRLTFLAAALLGSFASARATETSAANIVYILADDMGRGDVSAYNAQAAWKTPQIDRLAAEGMRFTDAHTSSSVCTPSRYSLLTGRYAWRSRLKRAVTYGYARPVIEEGRLTVAQLLHQRGYATGMVGKWHLGLEWKTRTPLSSVGELDLNDGEPVSTDAGQSVLPLIDYSAGFRRGPTELGFDSFFGISASLDMPPYFWLRNERADASPSHPVPRRELPAFWRGGPAGPDFQHIQVQTRITDEAVAFIKQAGTRQPFFLYVALAAPHTPILPTSEFAGKTGSPYGDFCVEVDRDVGRILAALEAKGIAGNTLVVFTADNGCSPMADFAQLRAIRHDPQPGLRGAKADIYEGGHRVPFIVRWPGRVARGAVSDALIGNVDVMATCAEIVGAKLPATAGEDSVSLLPVLDGRATNVRETIVNHSVNGSFAIRRGQWKLALCPDSGGWSDPKPGKAPKDAPPFQLFDLASDLRESRNLCLERPELVRELATQLRDQIRNGRSTPGAPQPNTGPQTWPELGWMDRI